MATFSQQALLQHRQSFSALEYNHYFNFGGQGPLPQPSLEAMMQAYQHLQKIGPFSGQAYVWMTERVEQLRAAIAAELSVDPITLSFTESVSGGCNIAMWGVNWQKGDRLLISESEHPTVVAVGQQLAHRYGVEVDVHPILKTLNGGDVEEMIASYIHPRTKMIVLSHVQWNTGQVLDLEAIARACRAANPEMLIVVDAAQSVGVLPLSLKDYDIDAYAFTGHKWWCGPDGLGGLYIPQKSLEKFEPTYLGWRGIRMDQIGAPIGWHPDGRRFEVATAAFPLVSGLQSALSLHRSFGTAEHCYERMCELSARLWEGLQQIPQVMCLKDSPPESGLVSFEIEGANHGQFVTQLEKQGYLLRLIKFPNCMRACVHYLTLESEVDTLLQKIQAEI